MTEWISVKDRLPPLENVYLDTVGSGTSIDVWARFENCKEPVQAFYWFPQQVWCDAESMCPQPQWGEVTEWRYK
jgi:hypothetical protein